MNRKSSSDEELTIDQVYLLQNFKDSWKSGKWEEKFEIAPCEEKYELIRYFYVFLYTSTFN